MSRRPDGALEAEVMRVLWASDVPKAPADIRDELASDLAYTSVATVLNRLCDKGLVTRRPDGRRFVYRAASSEADLAGRRLHTMLETADDRAAVLAGFLRTLSDDDARILRSLLDHGR